jgi:hypothetical protein
VRCLITRPPVSDAKLRFLEQVGSDAVEEGSETVVWDPTSSDWITGVVHAQGAVPVPMRGAILAIDINAWDHSVGRELDPYAALLVVHRYVHDDVVHEASRAPDLASLEHA